MQTMWIGVVPCQYRTHETYGGDVVRIEWLCPCCGGKGWHNHGLSACSRCRGAGWISGAHFAQLRIETIKVLSTWQSECLGIIQPVVGSAHAAAKR